MYNPKNMIKSHEKTLESICLDLGYDDVVSFAKTKHGSALFFFDCNVYIGDTDICIEEHGNRVYIPRSKKDFVSRLFFYRKKGGKTTTKKLTEKYL